MKMRDALFERVVKRYARECRANGLVCQQPAWMEMRGNLVEIGNIRGRITRYRLARNGALLCDSGDSGRGGEVT